MSDVWSDERAGSDVRESMPTGRATISSRWSPGLPGARTALDVATGGGHVARRLREAGLEVVTTDRAPGMSPDVICPAEDLPFADASFDVVACRTAAHHFDDVAAAVREMARVSADRVLLVDTDEHGRCVEEAEKLRDPVARPQLHRGRMAGSSAAAGLESPSSASSRTRSISPPG